MSVMRMWLHRGNYYQLAAGLTLNKQAIEDHYLHQRHVLKPQAYFILHHVVEAQNSLTATAALYSKHYKRVSYDQALSTVNGLLNDLSARFIVEGKQTFFRRRGLGSDRFDSFLTIMRAVAWCQWPLFVLLSLLVAMSLTWLRVPLLPEALLVFASLWLGTALHEFGHYWPLSRSKKKVVLLAQRGRVSIVYPRRLPTASIISATLCGPLLATGFGVVLGLNTLLMRSSLQKLLVVPILLILVHGTSLLFGQQDSHVLQSLSKRKRLQIKEVDMKTLIRKISLSVAAFISLIVLFMFVGFIFAASVDKGYVGVKALSLLGLTIVRVTANGQGFELVTGPGLFIIPLTAAAFTFFGSIVLEKTISKASSSQA